jgi:seryl-tRNA synthetase
MPIDINLLRKDKGGDPDKVRESEKRRFRKIDLVDEVIALDEQWIKAQYDTEQVKKEQNAIQKQITERKKASKGQDKCEELVSEKDALTEKIAALKQQSDEILTKRDNKLHYIGNIVHDSVPVSNDEEKDNKIVKDWCPEKGKLECGDQFKKNFIHNFPGVEQDATDQNSLQNCSVFLFKFVNLKFQISIVRFCILRLKTLGLRPTVSVLTTRSWKCWELSTRIRAWKRLVIVVTTLPDLV